MSKKVRTRYCEIKATTLEEILAVCERHVANINKTHADAISEGEGTPLDDFYCNMFRDAWLDLRDDVRDILTQQREDAVVEVEKPEAPAEAPKVFYTAHIVQHISFVNNVLDKIEGYSVHLSEKDSMPFTGKKHGNIAGSYVESRYLGEYRCSRDMWFALGVVAAVSFPDIHDNTRAYIFIRDLLELRTWQLG